MRLLLQHHRVRDIQWGDETRLANGVLWVDRDALAAHLRQDPRIETVAFDIARPGESCRIFPVFDIVEPRCKVGDGGSDFPGVIGPLVGAGSGVTAVLRGMATTIVSPDPFNPDAPIMGQLLEMQPLQIDESGPTELTAPYSELVHLVILPRCADGLDRYDRSNALRHAVLRASVFLARTALQEVPESEEAFDLENGHAATVRDRREVQSLGLPRIAYVFQLHSHQRPTAPGEPILYGDNARHLLPTVLHPNEVLDGGVLPGYNSMGMETYAVQNHGVILDLYRRHGRDLDFAGVVAVVAHQTVDERARTNVMAANLVRYALRADGAVFTKSGGGAPHVAMAEVARQCELLGVKTALLAWETSEGESASEGSALFNYPELNAIVNYGCNGFGVPLPAVERVITVNPALGMKLERAMRVNTNRLCGAMDQLGSGVLTAARY